ncbi:transglycosylase domain-containing protein [Fusibacter paucivorans]|uniref:Penicillin-binding protein 1A n=1 Tax=Fusibacter paucivorans TaxID=76009 RepID=A0ABS5PTP3_9FIRM|nr:transglycosylase domain-containing protein [Fusibacter paucivorans]MBS7528545.1 transglycosylase domain-containing protein [Fusibacter paucivorans]
MERKNKVSSTPASNGRSPKKKRKKSSFNIINILKVLLIVGVLCGIIGGAVGYFYVMGILKNIEPIDPSLIEATLTENSVIVDDQGRVLEQIRNAKGLRTVVRFDEISDNLINAFVSVEDKTFWHHNGFNFIRLVGAVKDSVLSGKRIGGTSTITQQLARNIYLPDSLKERTIDRKVKEAYYAIELEKYLKKEQIIEAYLNLIYLGSSSNGVEAASEIYFNKNASELDLVEAAMLAGVPKEPLRYAPMITKEKVDVTEEDYIIDDSDPLYTIVFNTGCIDRYKTVIYLMHENGYISDAEYDAAKDVDLRTKLNPGQAGEAQITSYFADMVKDDVINDLMATYDYSYSDASNMLYTNGLVIHSTIDFDMQKTLESNYALDNFTEYYSESTYSAVKAFQSAYGLSSDGIAGQTTLSKIAEVSNLNLSLFTQNIYKKGVSAEEVIELNRVLYEMGYYSNNENFPRVTVRVDSEGNIISQETKRILLYRQENFVDSNMNLIIPASDYQFDSEGNLVLFKNKRLSFYPHYQDDQLVSIQVVVKETYKYDNGEDTNAKLSAGTHNISGLYTYEGRDVFIPNEYKSFDENKNVIVDKSFFTENPDFFTVDANNNLLVGESDYYISSTGIIQPQSAMVIVDYRTGELKAIVGGRNITGQKIYNRATNPRQPGSSIKPLSVFTPAIDSGKYTAATVLDDIPVYLSGDPNTRWPVNWYENSSSYSKYWGLVTLRESVQWSINVTAALIAQDLGVDTTLSYLEKFGITSLVKEGNSNDYNLSAVSLGGMTKGVSPFEMTSAYGAIANKGVRNETITYSSVENRSGDIILENKQEKTYVVDENVAYVVQDMMKSSVLNGVASSAKLYPNNDTIPVSGKTGTTSNKMDAWFIGYTPYYVGGVWFGNDINIPLDQGSKVSAQFWQKVMTEIHADLEPMDFEKPDGVVTAMVDTKSGKKPTELSYMDPRNTVTSEVFLRGTEPKEDDDVHVAGNICLESGKLATEKCPTTLVETRVFVKRPVPYDPETHLDRSGNPIYPGDWIYELPSETCDIHNSINIDIFDYTGYEDVVPAVTFPDGSRIVQRPFYIELTDGQKILLPVSTKILADNTVIFPDNSTIPSYMVKSIPIFDLQDYNQGTNATPDVNNAINEIDDNSNVTEDDFAN